jgi:hypothetical protein
MCEYLDDKQPKQATRIPGLSKKTQLQRAAIDKNCTALLSTDTPHPIIWS